MTIAITISGLSADSVASIKRIRRRLSSLTFNHPTTLIPFRRQSFLTSRIPREGINRVRAVRTSTAIRSVDSGLWILSAASWVVGEFEAGAAAQDGVDDVEQAEV